MSDPKPAPRPPDVGRCACSVEGGPDDFSKTRCVLPVGHEGPHSPVDYLELERLQREQAASRVMDPKSPMPRPPNELTLTAIGAEVMRARVKFPSNRHLLAALLEECGELAKALLEEMPRDEVQLEAIQVAAVAVRIIEEGDADFAARDAAQPTSAPDLKIQHPASTSVTTLADAILEQIARVRDQVLPAYLEIGSAGQAALVMMRIDLDAAARALAEQDGVACLSIFEKLKGWET